MTNTDELRHKIDDITARLHPTDELDNDNKPVYKESRLPLSILDELVKLIQDWHLQKCRSYLPEKKDYMTRRHETKWDPQACGIWNEAIDTITKRIGGDDV